MTQPVFFVYQPLNHPDIKLFINKWNELVCKEKIAKKFYFIANASDSNYSDMQSFGFDAAIPSITGRLEMPYKQCNVFFRALHYFSRLILHTSLLISYKDCLKFLWNPNIDAKEFVIPSLLPNWDHSPRSGNKRAILINCTPELFKRHCLQVLEGVKYKKNKVIFLKSWNEWGEGNYMEPDLRYGKGFIRALSEAKKEVYP